ncbi:discoidin, CUB and LCCL domain-containing protein 2 [Cololabis saira]|uniref:discoidin, CUB and LCCL domain-containing protein 2 n=1 Tax=Cololabis saira TaxID=129043 RepID=UPI002AD2A618|nr:discoidin, CUB and LCCL domain-containing protein 2 [Cololabis saira]
MEHPRGGAASADREKASSCSVNEASMGLLPGPPSPTHQPPLTRYVIIRYAHQQQPPPNAYKILSCRSTDAGPREDPGFEAGEPGPRSGQHALGLQAAVMLGGGPSGAAGLLVLWILAVLTQGGCRAQKGDGCGPSVLGPGSGTLSSLGYPRTYPNNSVCEWEIRVPPGQRIHFRFALLDIEDGDCQVNYLRLHDGIGPGRSQIEKFCGLGLEVGDLIQSSGNQVTVQFMSGTHHTGRGFYLSYSTTEHPDLITCLDRGSDFPEAEYSKYCPAGCLTSPEEISGSIPKGYRESSPLCVAAVHAGVVSDAAGGRISVVSSKGIHHYEGTLANNVTSTGGTSSNSLFTFRTSGCYGKLGLESGGVLDGQLSASSSWDWSADGDQNRVWGPPGARLKRAGLPWAPAHSDPQQWLQVDLKKETKITGIITTGSTRREFPYFVSAFRLRYSDDGRKWFVYSEADSTRDKVFQGNTNYLQEVRNNFLPPLEARFVRISPASWQQRIALKLELLGCQAAGPARRTTDLRPRMSPDSPPLAGTKRPPYLVLTTPTPDIRNTTMPPHTGKDGVLAAVLIPVLVTVSTVLVLAVVCTLYRRNRKQSSERTYDLPQWDRTDWWKSMKQLLPSKMVETEDSVRYSSSEVGRRAGPGLHAAPAEYAQPLVSGVPTLGARSTFKPDEGPDPGYSDPELYDAPLSPAYAEPLPASGAEYATPIVVDMGCHPAALLSRTNSGGGGSPYDTPKMAAAAGQATPPEDLTYQVPQSQRGQS